VTAVELLKGRDVAEMCCVGTRRTRRGQTQKIAERIDAVAGLVEVRGCVATSALMRELSVSHSQALYALRLLQVQNRAVEIVIGRTAIWCRDRETAEELVSRLKETVHRLVDTNGIRHATPTKVLRAALRDKETYELLSAFIPLTRYAAGFHPTALAFIRHMLQTLYGEPLRYANSKYVYIVP
jgi:hypothetical protein